MLFPSPNSQSSIQTKNQPILLYKGCHSVIAPVAIVSRLPPGGKNPRIYY